MVRIAILLSVLMLLAIAALVMSLAPMMEVTAVEIEPYVDTETYTRTEAFTEEVSADYQVIEADRSNMWWRRTSDCWVTLKNTGNFSGYFRVRFDVVTEDNKETTKVLWQMLDPGEQKNVRIRYYEDYVDSFTYSVTPPLGEVTTLREVTGTRDVVKYRQVGRTEKVTVLEYLTDWRGKS